MALAMATAPPRCRRLRQLHQVLLTSGKPSVRDMLGRGDPRSCVIISSVDHLLHNSGLSDLWGLGTPARRVISADAAAASPRFQLGTDGLSRAEQLKLASQLQEVAAAHDFQEAASLQNVLKALGPDGATDLVRLHSRCVASLPS